MPIATPFTTLGMGNGFPFCAHKTEVSTCTHWVTLGGVSSGTATEAQIELSRANAMKLYWNLFKIKVDADCNISSGSNISVGDLQVGLEPKDRLCALPSISDKREYVSPFGGDYDSAEVKAYGSNHIITEMYNSGTFVGYGLRHAFCLLRSMIVPFGFGGFDATIEIASYTWGNGGTTDSEYYKSVTKIYNTTLSGIPFISISSASSGGLTYNTALTTNPLNTSASYTDFSNGSVASASVTVHSLEYYTYI